jgi:hypothetical protein
MAIEKARGCGFRVCGALYLVSDGVSRWCGRLPLPTSLEQSRQFQLHPLIEVLAGTDHIPCRRDDCTGARFTCPLRWPPRIDPTTPVGVSWVGERDYTPQSFTLEVEEMGVSKRVPGIPAGLELGRTWVFLAHPKGYTCDSCYRCGGPRGESECSHEDGHLFDGPGLFHAFVPQRVECLVEDDRLEEEWVQDLKAKGVTIIPVPADDPDHARGTTSHERKEGSDAGSGGPVRPARRDGLPDRR